jgi:hypothetical protein
MSAGGQQHAAGIAHARERLASYAHQNIIIARADWAVSATHDAYAHCTSIARFAE